VIYALSFHADYKCQRSGVCCSSDWDVPVELALYRTLDDALRGQRLAAAAAAADNEPALLAGPDLPDDAGAMVSRTSTGDCVFYHRHSGLCVIQRDLGEPFLPATCRYFPRLAVRDWRGTFISLSHYCPTAAGMLFREDMPLEIVEAPAAFPPLDYEGLRVDPDAWPPLLHPTMLMDPDGYSAWERHMVMRCATDSLSPESVIATLDRDARLLRAFQPGGASLADAVAALPSTAVAASAPTTLDGSLTLHREIVAAIPEDIRPEPDEARLADTFAGDVKEEWRRWQAPLKRYLAAKAFASWTAYQGRGVLSIVRGLEAALALVRVEASRECRNAGRPLDEELLTQAIRGADFVLNHLAVGETLADTWSRVEHSS
jgi:hypothetical protein